MRILASLFALIFLFAPQTTAAKSPIPQPFPPKIHEWHRSVGQLHFKIKQEMFGIEFEQEVMTATAWAATDKYLVTAGHVCASMEAMASETRSPNMMSMTYIDENDVFKEFGGLLVMRQNPITDLCVLYAKGHPLKVLEVETNPNNIRIFNQVNMVGAPLGVFPQWKQCVIQSRNGNEQSEKVLQNRLLTTCESAPGFSGSPVISDTNKVVGVIAGMVMPNETYITGFMSFGASAPQILHILSNLP